MRGILNHQLEEFRSLATHQADDGPEDLMAQVPDVIDGWEPDVGGSQYHVDNTDEIRALFDGRYARGVADFLDYLAGAAPSVELMQLLALRSSM